MVWLLIALGVPAPLPMVALPAPAPRRPVVVPPSWDHRPTPQDLLAAFPVDAIVNAVDGHAVIVCRVMADESVTGCKVVSEDPPGAGFGEAALTMQSSIRLHPQTVNGVATSDGSVSIPFSFKVATLGIESGIVLADSERCVGYAQANLGADIQFAPEDAVWTGYFAAAAGQSGAKPSEIIDRMDAARVAAAQKRLTKDGQADVTVCHKYFQVIVRQQAQLK
jgi:hypothetical protein